MAKQANRVFAREFKEAAVQRILAGERVLALAVELGIKPQILYRWRNGYEWGGAAALLPSGRPPQAVALALGLPVPKAPRAKTRRQERREARIAPDRRDAARIAELERKLGQQALELDFFARALRHVKAPPPSSGNGGATASSTSSTR
jgi:transposase